MYLVHLAVDSRSTPKIDIADVIAEAIAARLSRDEEFIGRLAVAIADKLDGAKPVVAAGELVSTADAAAILGVTREAIYKWVGDGAPHERMGDLYRFRVEALLEWSKTRGKRRKGSAANDG